MFIQTNANLGRLAAEKAKHDILEKLEINKVGIGIQSWHRRRSRGGDHTTSTSGTTTALMLMMMLMLMLVLVLMMLIGDAVRFRRCNCVHGQCDRRGRMFFVGFQRSFLENGDVRRALAL